MPTLTPAQPQTHLSRVTLYTAGPQEGDQSFSLLDARRRLAQTIKEMHDEAVFWFPLQMLRQRAEHETVRRYIQYWDDVIGQSSGVIVTTSGMVLASHHRASTAQHQVLFTRRLTNRLPDAVEERLQQLVALHEGWNGDGTQPITSEAHSVVRRELNNIERWAVDDVFLVPTPAGGIRMEWVADSGQELTVIVPPQASEPVVFYRYSEEPAFEEELFEVGYGRLPEMLAWYHQQ